MRPVPLDPIQQPIAQPPQRRDILRQQHQADRQHPNPENRQNAEERAGDEQNASDQPDPAEPRPAQPTDGFLQPLRQPIDQSLEAPLMMLGGAAARGRSATGSSAPSDSFQSLCGLVLPFRITSLLSWAPCCAEGAGRCCRGANRSHRARDIDRSDRASAPDTVIRHREVARPCVGVLARGARINRWPRRKKGRSQVKTSRAETGSRR